MIFDIFRFATFAYFVASTQTEGTGNTAKTTTQNMEGATLNFLTTGEVLNKLDYPGGLGIYGATASISKEGTDTNNYEATFDIEIEYANLTGTNLEWELWMLSKNLDQLTYADGKSLSDVTTCKLKIANEGSNNYYWYADENDNGGYNSGDRCDAEAIRKAVQDDNGELIAYGEFKANTPSGYTDADDAQLQKIDKNTVCAATAGSEIKCSENSLSDSDPIKSLKEKITSNQLQNRKLYTINNEGHPSSKVYYLVVKYPNNKDDQSTADKGKLIKVSLKVGAGANSVLYTES